MNRSREKVNVKEFEYFLPQTDLIFGKGVLRWVGKKTRELGSKALIISGKTSMEKLGFLDKVIDYLGEENIGVFHYGGVEPNPTVEIVNRGADEALNNRCEVIVGLGGGSSLDVAKAVAVVAGHSHERKVSVWDFQGVHKNPRQITEKTLPIVAITSTSGTGSHVSRFSVVTNPETRRKQGLMSPFIFPKVSIVDLDIVSKMPPRLTARTGFDVMAHLMEGFVSKKANPVSDLYCLKGIELVFRYLPRACKKGYKEARWLMALADTYAGWVITTSRPVLPHAMSHPISAFYPKIEHGMALAALTSAVMRFNIERASQETLLRYCMIARCMGKKIYPSTKKEPLKSIEGLKELLDKIELNIGLKELGVKDEDFEKMAESAFLSMRGAIEGNPVKVNKKDIVELYKKSF